MLSFQMYIHLSYYFYTQYYWSSDRSNKYQGPCTYLQENLGLFLAGDEQMSKDCGFLEQRCRLGSNSNSIHFLQAIANLIVSISIKVYIKEKHKNDALLWIFS